MAVQRIQPQPQGQYINLPPRFCVFNDRHEILGRDHTARRVKQANEPFVKGDTGGIAGAHDRLKGQQCLTMCDGFAHHLKGRGIALRDRMVQRAVPSGRDVGDRALESAGHGGTLLSVLP